MEKRLSVTDFNRRFTRGLGKELFSDENLTIIEDVNNLPFWRQINQVDFALVILCKHGRLEATLNNVNYTVQAGDMIFCSGMHTMTEALITTDFDYDLFCRSMRLGFPNTSFFGKFTKEHLGCSPMQYRSNGRSNVIHTPARR